MYLHEVMADVFAGKVASRGSAPGEFVFYLGSGDYAIRPGVAVEVGVKGCRLAPVLARKTADGEITLLVPSQIDMTCDDWVAKKR